MAVKPKELVVISGKGGTGKTSVVASFAALADSIVLADCDVDAADLHLVLDPEIIRRESFSGGKRARIDPDRCIGCGKCAELCRFGAISLAPADASTVNSACSNCKRACPARTNSDIQAMICASHEAGGLPFAIDPVTCEGCGVCAWFCPVDAIEFGPVVNGEWYVSETRHGPMVHAKLGVAEENSGKLVSIVRRKAGRIAEQRGLDTVLIDGSPGIGCPVIASITGADLALIVTEPTLSGLHDLGRIADVARHFEVSCLVCVNKWDINPDMTTEIEHHAGERGLSLAGRVRYDRAVTDAQIHKQAVVEYQQNGCAEDIREVWGAVKRALDGGRGHS
jgi:MinD superfamily P-loop ATPase